MIDVEMVNKKYLYNADWILKLWQEKPSFAQEPMVPVIHLQKVDDIVSQAVWAMQILRVLIAQGYHEVWEDHPYPPTPQEIVDSINYDGRVKQIDLFLNNQFVMESIERQKAP